MRLARCSPSCVCMPHGATRSDGSPIQLQYGRTRSFMRHACLTLYGHATLCDYEKQFHLQCKHTVFRVVTLKPLLSVHMTCDAHQGL